MTSGLNLLKGIIYKQIDHLWQKSHTGVPLDRNELECLALLITAEAKVRVMPPQGQESTKAGPGAKKRWHMKEEDLLKYAETEGGSGS